MIDILYCEGTDMSVPSECTIFEIVREEVEGTK
jgi:hypothetical protein